MKKIMLCVLFIYLTACSSGGGDGASGGSVGTPVPSIDSPPISAIPMTPSSNSSALGGAGGGTCGLNGTFGLCRNLVTGDTQSMKVYSVISNCNTVASKYTYYTGANCSGSSYYERTLIYDLVVGDDSSITGAKEVAMTLSSVTQEYMVAAAYGTHQADYLNCDSDVLSSYASTPKQSKTAYTCYASNSSSLTDYGLIKVTSEGLYGGYGTSCTGYNDECISTGQRPTSLNTAGVPIWQ